MKLVCRSDKIMYFENASDIVDMRISRQMIIELVVNFINAYI